MGFSRCTDLSFFLLRTSFSDGYGFLRWRGWGEKQGEPYQFTHLIILSRVYHLSEEEEAELLKSAPGHSRSQGDSNTPKQKKHKKQQAQESGEKIQRAPDGIYAFHPEDDVIVKVCIRCFHLPE